MGIVQASNRQIEVKGRLNALGQQIAKKAETIKLKLSDFQDFLSNLTKLYHDKYLWAVPINQYLQANSKQLYEEYLTLFRQNCMTIGLFTVGFRLSELYKIFNGCFVNATRKAALSVKVEESFYELIVEAKAFLSIVRLIQETVKQIGGKQNNFKETLTTSVDNENQDLDLSKQSYRTLRMMANTILSNDVSELNRALEKLSQECSQGTAVDQKRELKALKYFLEFSQKDVSFRRKRKLLQKMINQVQLSSEIAQKFLRRLMLRVGSASCYPDLVIMSEIGCQNAWHLRIIYDGFRTI